MYSFPSMLLSWAENRLKMQLSQWLRRDNKPQQSKLLGLPMLLVKWAMLGKPRVCYFWGQGEENSKFLLDFSLSVAPPPPFSWTELSVESQSRVWRSEVLLRWVRTLLQKSCNWGSWAVGTGCSPKRVAVGVAEKVQHCAKGQPGHFLFFWSKIVCQKTRR